MILLYHANPPVTILCTSQQIKDCGQAGNKKTYYTNDHRVYISLPLSFNLVYINICELGSSWLLN